VSPHLAEVGGALLATAQTRHSSESAVEQGKEPPLMTCPECGSHARESAAFCTACGWDLLVQRAEWIDRVWCSAAGVAR
jgi:hypothetical protein